MTICNNVLNKYTLLNSVLGSWVYYCILLCTLYKTVESYKAILSQFSSSLSFYMLEN